jgi:hypothetical protein
VVRPRKLAPRTPLHELAPGYRRGDPELYRELPRRIGEVVVKRPAVFLGTIALIADRPRGSMELLCAACDHV